MINPSEITDNTTQGKETDMQKIACPYTYSNGKGCTGHIVRVEAYKADVEWDCADDGKWRFSFAPRSHYHLFCSEKGNHAGYARPDSEKMKFYGDQLPKPIRDLIGKTGISERPTVDLAIADKKDAT